MSTAQKPRSEEPTHVSNFLKGLEDRYPALRDPADNKLLFEMLDRTVDGEDTQISEELRGRCLGACVCGQDEDPLAIELEGLNSGDIFLMRVCPKRRPLNSDD